MILKIIKHAKQANFKLACGQLHGLYQNKSIEISNCYPIPNASRDDQVEVNYSLFYHLYLKMSL